MRTGRSHSEKPGADLPSGPRRARGPPGETKLAPGPSGAWLSAAGAALREDVEDNGGQQHQTLDHLLIGVVDAQERHTVEQHTDDQTTDDGADDAPDAAGDRRSADEGGGNRAELETVAVGGISQVDASREYDAGQRGQGPAAWVPDC